MVAAIGEQILGPTDVSLSNWTVRPSSGCSVVLATHTAGVSVDGYTLTLAANPWNIVRTYNLTPGQELLFACRYRLGTASDLEAVDVHRSSRAGPAPGSAPQSAASPPRSEVHLGSAPGTLVAHEAVQGVVDVVCLGHVHREVVDAATRRRWRRTRRLRRCC